MHTIDIREFLAQFKTEVLEGRGILNYCDRRLNNLSVNPLLQLMREDGVQRLEHIPDRWYLDVSGAFANPGSTSIKAGHISELSNRGEVFSHRNVTLNPYYRS
jgi:hypothetical protein